MRIEADWLTAAPLQEVLGVLSGGGHAALLVGGCVRNALLGAPVGDMDIATDARPDRVSDLAEAAGLRAVPTGIDHGTITVVAQGEGFEVTTFRRDVETDGRRAVVAFSDTMEEDARRRDFTMNALYARADGVVLDPLGGMPDLLSRRVRFVEDAARRIAEDYLRILRFFRFHAWYGDPGGGLDPEALAAIGAAVDGLDGLSKERVGAEMRKLLAAPDPLMAVAAMERCGALGHVLPGADARLLGPALEVENQLVLPPDWLRRLLTLGGADPTTALRLSRAETRRLEDFGKAQEMTPAVAAWKFCKDTGYDLAVLAAAAAATPAPDDLHATLDRAAAARFPVRAADLAPLEGPALGQRLRALEEAWLASGFTLDRAALLALP